MPETAHLAVPSTPRPVGASSPRLLVVSPVHDEAAHIERVALAMAAQTRRPEQWILVDDQSTDATPRILARLAEQLDFVSVLQSPPRSDTGASKDRLAIAAEARAFNFALNSVPWQSFTHIAKLDGDIELAPRYFELLLDEFAADPKLGLAGGVLRESDGNQGREDTPSDYHVRGALKCYTTDCLSAIGGIEERLAWDTNDEIFARMRGFRTRTVTDLVALHLRPCASADGVLRGIARHGRCAYIAQFPLSWISLRAVKLALQPPVVLSGFAFLGGYLWAGVMRVPRVEDRQFRRFIRRELRTRALDALGLARQRSHAHDTNN
jgi:glycosyltransferase involved in cell wall biosynthesis